MTSGAYTRSRYFTLLAVASLAGALAACGGSSAEPMAPTASATTTTVAPPTTSSTRPAPTTTTTMPPYSFDGSVPPPEIVNTGDDYIAILASYDRYLDWLTGHNPDPGLLANVFVDGTDAYAQFEKELKILRDRRLRLFDVNRSFAATVMKADAGIVSMVMREEPTEIRLVDASGTIVDQGVESQEIRASVTLVARGERWLIGSLFRLQDLEHAKVQL